MATKQDVVNRILLLLSSKAAQKIDFQFDSVHFVGSQFVNVTAKVFVKSWGYSGVGVTFQTMTNGAAAMYDPGSNEFVFPNADFGLTSDERMDIVHESIHAWLDIRMPKIQSVSDAIRKVMLTTTKASDEATAYIGGSLFYIYDNFPDGTKPKQPDAWTSPIHLEAFRIAASIAGKPGATVSAADSKSLKQKIMDSATYSDIKADPTSSYGNDGV